MGGRLAKASEEEFIKLIGKIDDAVSKPKKSPPALVPQIDEESYTSRVVGSVDLSQTKASVPFKEIDIVTSKNPWFRKKVNLINEASNGTLSVLSVNDYAKDKLADPRKGFWVTIGSEEKPMQSVQVLMSSDGARFAVHGLGQETPQEMIAVISALKADTKTPQTLDDYARKWGLIETNSSLDSLKLSDWEKTYLAIIATAYPEGETGVYAIGPAYNRHGDSAKAFYINGPMKTVRAYQAIVMVTENGFVEPDSIYTARDFGKALVGMNSYAEKNLLPQTPPDRRNPWSRKSSLCASMP